MTVVGDGLQRRDFTHVSDVVNANIKASNKHNNECVGQTFNVGTGVNHNILDIVNMVGGAHKFIPHRPGESRVTLACTKKISKVLGWQPSVKLEDWMSKNAK